MINKLFIGEELLWSGTTVGGQGAASCRSLTGLLQSPYFLCSYVYSATSDSISLMSVGCEECFCEVCLVVAPTGIRNLDGNATSTFIIFEEFLRLGLISLSWISRRKYYHRYPR